MSDAVIVLVVLAAGTYAFKSAGPLFLGSRTLPAPIRSLVDLLPASLLAALTVVSTVGGDQEIVVDARLVGVAVAGVALWRRLPFVVVVILASAATAFVRLFS